MLATSLAHKTFARQSPINMFTGSLTLIHHFSISRSVVVALENLWTSRQLGRNKRCKSVEMVVVDGC